MLLTSCSTSGGAPTSCTSNRSGSRSGGGASNSREFGRDARSPSPPIAITQTPLELFTTHTALVTSPQQQINPLLTLFYYLHSFDQLQSSPLPSNPCNLTPHIQIYFCQGMQRTEKNIYLFWSHKNRISATKVKSESEEERKRNPIPTNFTHWNKIWHFVIMTVGWLEGSAYE